MDNDDLLPLAQAARQLGLSAGSLRDMIKAGLGPVAIVSGRRWIKIRRRDLDAYIDRCTIRPRDAAARRPVAAEAAA